MSASYYLTTHGRINAQVTWRNLPAAVRERITVVCSPAEAPLHRAEGRRVLVCPVQGQLTRVRQWLLEQTPTALMFLMDDDLQFYHRRNQETTAMRNATAEETVEGFDRMERMLRQGYIMVGLGDRPGNNRCDVPVDFSARPHTVFGFLVPALRRLNYRFRPPLMSDFDMILQILRGGHAVPTLTDFFCGQVGSVQSNAPGGCSSYRTPELLRQVVLQIQKEFGPTVIHPRTAQADWGKIQHRIDVSVQWLKLWRAARVAHGDWTDENLLRFAPERITRPSLLSPFSVVFEEGTRSGVHIRRFPADMWEREHQEIWQLSVADPKVQFRYSFTDSFTE